MKATRTMKFKLRPDMSQKKQLFLYLKTFSFVFNGYIKYNEVFSQKTGSVLSIKQMFSHASRLKKTFPVLKKVHSKLIDSAIVYCYQEVKKSKPTLPSPKNESEPFFFFQSFYLDQEKEKVSIPGILNIRYICSKKITDPIHSIGIQKKRNDWFLLVTYTMNISSSSSSFPLFIGIDVGLKEFAFLSNGKKVPNPRFYRQLEDKLIKEQRKLHRKKKNSKNWTKQLRKVQNVHRDIVHARTNFLHRLSTFIVERYDVIGIEKLPIQSMVRNKQFSKSIFDASWGMFIKMLKYKAEERSKTIVEVERFYPSSQLCSYCGSKQMMPLHLRTFVCKSCHHTIDRDYNASKNIENRARELIKKG